MPPPETESVIEQRLDEKPQDRVVAGRQRQNRDHPPSQLRGTAGAEQTA
jgi:hypothetical protein